MAELWGPQRKFSTWRRLWVALAEAEAELGLPICAAADRRAAGARRRHRLRQAAALRAQAAARRDGPRARLWRRCAPTARPIIHLGATSCYVTDNTDLILMREGLELVARAAGRR